VARQKLGQHFLIKGAVLERIASAVCPQKPVLVVEIGPGRGALTEKLLKRADRVIAIELDPFLAAHLRAKFVEAPLEVVHADVLDIDLAQWGRVPIAGNLPYYITSPIIEKTLRSNFSRAVFLVQKEVALRLTAQPGTRDYGFLTVQTAVFAQAKLLFEVKPSAFYPPPKVDSAVVLLEPRPLPIEPVEPFLEFVSRSFHHKRKTLRNNLVEFYGPQISTWPESSLRAEQLSLEQFLAMWGRL
jgi:16S rRNA (adenine1518-N6/adenine1519-N6)-dimethyltransferase